MMNTGANDEPTTQGDETMATTTTTTTFPELRKTEAPRASARFAQLRTEAEDLLQSIAASLKAEYPDAGQLANWGQVGDMAEIVSNLRGISDFVNREGEYAD